ncbi:MAG TPA: deoxyribodipyrimidine photo-lyase [Bacteriovoracaceae bacterium]|nr:deoxyribodipyrimidine photo-lyase [Bacteriovoracaceae bacterium]
MKSICWIRRDLRLHDNAALSFALNQGEVHLVFIFDTHILDKLKDKRDARVTFIYQSLMEIQTKASLHFLYGKPEEEVPKLAQRLKVSHVFSNRDYEPYAKARDAKVKAKLKSINIEFEQFKDSVVFEQHEVLTNTGGIYKVFTPYKNKWLHLFEQNNRMVPNYKCNLKNLARFDQRIMTLSEIGFIEAPPHLTGGTKPGLKRLKKFADVINDYAEARNFPFKEGTSGLSPYLRFGNLSVRDMVRSASDGTWLSEIIWRDFYQMILDIHPHVTKGPFRPEYNQIKWKGDPKHFELWCKGLTGFPLVDAAMRCLNQTGLMHNRLRMVVASFLCKTLLIDWRKGEEYFAQKLLDFDLASNNGGWQWASSSGADAQPYFRIFNPYTQSEKFDPDGIFIRKWCPELAHLSNRDIHKGLNIPIVSYQNNRIRCIDMYNAALSQSALNSK